MKIKINVINMFRNIGNGGEFYQRTGIYKTNQMKILELENSVTNIQNSIDGLVAYRSQLKRGFMSWKAHLHKVSRVTHGEKRMEVLEKSF